MEALWGGHPARGKALHWGRPATHQAGLRRGDAFVSHHLSEAAALTPLLRTECSPPEAGARLPGWKQNHVQYVSPACGLG